MKKENKAVSGHFYVNEQQWIASLISNCQTVKNDTDQVAICTQQVIANLSACNYVEARRAVDALEKLQARLECINSRIMEVLVNMPRPATPYNAKCRREEMEERRRLYATPLAKCSERPIQVNIDRLADTINIESVTEFNEQLSRLLQDNLQRSAERVRNIFEGHGSNHTKNENTTPRGRGGL